MDDSSRTQGGLICVAVFIVGVTMVSSYGIESDVRMSPGDVSEIAGYSFKGGA